MPSGQLQYAYGAFVPRASKCSEGRCEKAPGVDSGVGHVSWSGHWRATHAFICILTLGRAPRMNLCSSKAGTTSSETGRGWQARGTLHSGAGKRTDCGQSGEPRLTRVDSATPGMSTQRCASSPRPPFPLWLNGETHPREHDEPCWTETRVGQTTIGSGIFRFLQGTYCRRDRALFRVQGRPAASLLELQERPADSVDVSRISRKAPNASPLASGCA